MDIVSFYVLLQDNLQLLNIKIEGDKEINLPEKNTYSFTVKGLYSDSIERDITEIDSVKYYIRDKNIVDSIGKAAINGKNKGNSQYIVVYKTFVDSIFVNVTENTQVKQTLLSSFDAVLNNKKINLNWQTAQEYKNAYFTVQRSKTGLVFDSIGKVAGKGTIYNSSIYNYTDSVFTADTLYYRLKLTDSINDFNYSNTVQVITRPQQLQTILTNFVAQLNDNKVNLNWSTSQEYKNDMFIIERGADSIRFDSIATIKGAGTINSNTTYLYTDSILKAGKFFYRLKWKTTNDIISYSDIISIVNSTTPVIDVFLGSGNIVLFPNPAARRLNLLFSNRGADSKDLQCRLINLQAKTILVSSLPNYDKLVTLYIPAMANGIYILEIRNSKAVKIGSAKLLIKQ